MAKTKKRSKRVPSVPQAKAEAAIAARNDSDIVAATIVFLLIVGVLLAAAYSRNSIYRTHVTLWTSVTESSPEKRRAHENLGQALSTAGSVAANKEVARKYYDRALQEFNTVLSLKDDGSVPMRDLYREIGVVYFRLGRYDEAIQSWKTGLRYAPYDPSLLNNLSIAMMQKGQMDKAASYASTALAGNPNMPQALNTLGQVYLAQGKYDKAIEYFLRAIEREPDVPSRYWNAALAFDTAKKYDKAFRYASKYVSMERNPAALQRGYRFLAHLKQMLGRQGP